MHAKKLLFFKNPTSTDIFVHLFSKEGNEGSTCCKTVKLMCNDCDQGEDEDQFHQIYDIVPKMFEYDTYQSRDQKWTLYYVNYVDSPSNFDFYGWHLDMTDDLGKSLLHAPRTDADCPSYVGYNTHDYGHWTYFNPENDRFVQDDGLNFTCLCGKRSLLSSGLVVMTPY